MSTQSVDMGTVGQNLGASQFVMPFYANEDLRNCLMQTPWTDGPDVVVHWTEPLAAHERLNEDLWHHAAAPEREFDPDAGWWLTDDAYTSIAAVVRGQLPEWSRTPRVRVDAGTGALGSDHVPAEPHFTVSVNLPGVSLGSSEVYADRLAWDVATVMARLCNPWGHGLYLFDEVRRDLQAR